MILDQVQQFASPLEALAHISEEAWSNYTKADYTLEQWHAACLIHVHEGDPTSKSQCKLPVKTPDGALNRNGVHAAAAALAGARGGLKGVSADQKKKAGNALKRYYAQLDEDPPESLTQSEEFVADILEHFGVKGMRWGVRNERESKPITGPVKEPITRTTANGDQFTMHPKAPGKIVTSLGKISKRHRDMAATSSSLEIKDKNGKGIGHASFWFKGKEDIYLNWISIDKSARGQGYATEVMKAAADHGAKTGRKRLVLEVPGNAPDAQHIYEKMGFKQTGVVQGNKRDVWGGLTQYEYRFDDKEG
jgi:ribosomal protein S18 acetylase RimI-like enzyme